MILGISLGALCCPGAEDVASLQVVDDSGTLVAEMHTLRCANLPGAVPCIILGKTRGVGARILAVNFYLDTQAATVLALWARTRKSDERVLVGCIALGHLGYFFQHGCLCDESVRQHGCGVLLMARRVASQRQCVPCMHVAGELARVTGAVRALAEERMAAADVPAPDACGFALAVQAVGGGCV